MADDIIIEKSILNGLAKGMEKEADNIAKEEQLISDSIQPLGRIVPEQEQENLNTVTSSLLEDIKQKRETAAQLRNMEL